MIFLWILHGCIIGLISWYFWRKNESSSIHRYYWYGLSANLIGGWLFGLAYKYFLGGGDTWSYFNSANILADLVANDVLTYLGIVIGGDIPESLLSVVGYTEQPRALLMVRITSIPNALTGGDYWLTSAYFSLFAFFGQWKLAQNVANTYDKSNSAALVAFVFYPSLVFWGSGLSKEAVFLGGFGWLVSAGWCRLDWCSIRPSGYKIT